MTCHGAGYSLKNSPRIVDHERRHTYGARVSPCSQVVNRFYVGKETIVKILLRKREKTEICSQSIKLIVEKYTNGLLSERWEKKSSVPGKSTVDRLTTTKISAVKPSLSSSVLDRVRSPLPLRVLLKNVQMFFCFFPIKSV